MARLRKSALAFDAITLEGSLISPAKLSEVAERRASEQAEADYHIPKGLTLRDETARYFRIAQALFRDLFTSPTPSQSSTIRFTHELLRDVFGFADTLPVVGQKVKDGRNYLVQLEALQGRVPVVVVPPSDDLDHASSHLSHDRRRSAAISLQDWLNADDNSLWGFCCNGERLRLLRDNQSLTRPAYIEANLRQLFEAEDFAGFAALWLMLHSSRFGRPGAPASDCALERWREAGNKEGLAARERLSVGVKDALLTLGNGFLAHPANSALRDCLAQGKLPLAAFFNELLRVVYRLIFLLVAEDRDLLHLPDATPDQRKLYAQGYSVSSLRDRSIRRSGWDEFHDRWEGLLIVFGLLVQGEPRLGLPGLGGLFDSETTPNINRARLANRTLMEAIFRLAWLRTDSTLMPVNWRDMETEELGSVYEGLLELTPRLTADGRSFAFAEGAESKGNERKKTGSYYTPDSLVQALLDSALDPVLDRVENEAEDASGALLGLSVIDPACGSGHFLLAAARRIATRIARLRTGGVPSAADYRHALRDAVRCCIHGVDRNPMAIELARVALWIETVEPGKPLGFLDANLRVGDSLLGIFSLEALDKGIPDTAYKALAGDDKTVAKDFEKRNKRFRDIPAAPLDFSRAGPKPLPILATSFRRIRSLPEDTVEEIASKRAHYRSVHSEADLTRLERASNVYIAAFLTPKTKGTSLDLQTTLVPTTDDVWTLRDGGQIYGPRLGAAVDIAIKARAFHWPLEFPDVMAKGGFDLVIGNPPWERIKIQEQEFFASREPEIAEAPNAAARGRMIEQLKQASSASRERLLYEEFELTKRLAEASSEFARLSASDGGRFVLTGRGDINTYALFAELFATLIGPQGRAGIIVPTGIATDATTSEFFGTIIESRSLIHLYSFENEEFIFPSVHHAYRFCLLTIGKQAQSEPQFAFFLRQAYQIRDIERSYTLSPEEITLINPNTRTAPIFRTHYDAELTARIYSRVPVLIEGERSEEHNPWKLTFHSRIWHMAEDSAWFRTAKQLMESGYLRDGADWVLPDQPHSPAGDVQPGDLGQLDNRLSSERYVPLFEAKMIHQFDHRWATYNGKDVRDVTNDEKSDLSYEPNPLYWVPASEVRNRLAEQEWNRDWLLGWRGICRATDERTLLADVIPRAGSGDTFLLMFPKIEPRICSCLLSCLNSLVCDYIVRQKIGGISFKLYLMRQISVLPPDYFTSSIAEFVISRTIELAYTSHSLAPFARDLGYDGPPFSWTPDRRAQLRSELDAWYARAYGLTRDELRYILDPTDVMGKDYPSETFRVLKNSEMRRYGQYRTQRLVLNAWDRMEAGELPAPIPYNRNLAQAAFVQLPVSQGDSAQRVLPLSVFTVPSMFPDGAWAMPAYNNISVQLQLAALLKKLQGPTPADNVRLAALYALRPDYLTPQLSGTDRNDWQRLVGNSSRASDAVNVIKFVPRTSVEWRDAYTQLRGMHALVEDSENGTWAPGSAVRDFLTEGWPDGRAGFVLKMLEGMDIGRSITMLPTDVQAWVRGYAA